jgi:hypothetical protein
MFNLYFETYYPGNQYDTYKNINDHLQNKYLLSLDGFSGAWKRIPWIMASNSVLFKTTTHHTQWFYDGLIPW